MMVIFQEAEKLQVKCSSNIIFFFEFAWMLAQYSSSTDATNVYWAHWPFSNFPVCQALYLSGPGESQDAGSKIK